MNNIEDPLEKFSEENLTEIINEKDDEYTTIKKYLLDYVSTVVSPLFRNSAQFDAKYKRALSFPAHTITAVFTGSILYIHDRYSTGQALPQTHEIKLLCTALTLHDINKFYNETKNADFSGNYSALIQDYFITDPFNLKTYFPEWKNELEEIIFLVQHAQESDDAQHETRFSRPKYAKLMPYIKIGDKVSSLSKSDYPLQEIHKKLKNEGHDVHLLLLPEMPQQLLSQIVYRSAKKFLVKSGSIPLLISPQGILYLSKNKINIDISKLKLLISTELIERMHAKPDFTDRKFDLAPLLAVPLNKNERFDFYVESVRKKTESGLLTVLGKTIYPEDTIIQESLASIAYFIYTDKKGSDWTEFPDLEKFINDDNLKEILHKIGQIRQNFADKEDVGGQKCKPYTVHELVQNNNNYIEPLKLLHDPVKNAILSKLESESSLLDSIIQVICTYNEETSKGIVDETFPEGKKNICFMCGAVADVDYKPGKHFLQSGGFTKRASLDDQYKRYCEACQIEFQLINDIIKVRDFREIDNLIFFYFYFDSIFINVDPFHEQMSKVDFDVQGTKTEKLGLDFTLGDFDTPFHIEPMAIRSKKDNSSISTRRARAIHTAIKACLNCGCKCISSSPYTLMRTYDPVFYNEKPTTLEKNIGIDRINNFKDAGLKMKQLEFINQLDGLKGLHRVQQFIPINVVPFVKSNVENFALWVNKNGYNLKKLLGDENLEMKEIAKKGEILFGKHFGNSSYKRVKIFRTALDSLMSSMAQKYSEEEAIRFAAAEVMKDVEREQYSPKKGKDIPADCLDYSQSIVFYLKKHGLWNVKKISQWGNPLTDLYEFEYILAIKT
ncbi:MAG: hypothetical protein WA130_09400 [Candidatus Methanoperedens sp.]